MMLKSLLAGMTLLTVSARAQYEPLPGENPSPAAALTPEMLQSLTDTLPMTAELRAAQNALAHNSIKSLVLNPQVENRNDALFSHEIKNPGSIADQNKSGRCWLFAGLNALRPAVIAKHGMKDFMLSQAYEQFYEELEAANRSLELAIGLRQEPIHSRRLDTFLQNLISDGGDWNYVHALIQKYGAVPEAVMPDDYAAANTGEMDALLAACLRKAAIEIRQPVYDEVDAAKLHAWKMAKLQDIYKILVLCLGQPPATFQWRYENSKGKITSLKTYTPQLFCKKFLDADLDRYVSFANYPGQPMRARLQWSWQRNMADHPDMEAVNLEMADMMDMVRKSILADEPVWFAANVSVEGDSKKGLWLADIEDKSDLFGIDFSMSKADTLAFKNGTPNHAMVITGVDVHDGKVTKWKVENSWGKDAGDKGWFTIDNQWADKHLFQVIVDRRFVPPALLALTTQKPIVLPPWDPFTDWMNESSSGQP
jgi:bleomycin hydrolase